MERFKWNNVSFKKTFFCDSFLMMEGIDLATGMELIRREHWWYLASHYDRLSGSVLFFILWPLEIPFRFTETPTSLTNNWKRTFPPFFSSSPFNGWVARISLCPVSFPKCLAAPAPSPVIWNPTSSADYFLPCFTSWIILFCLSLLPYCPQTVPSPTSTSPASERTPEVRGLTGSPALKGASLGQYLLARQLPLSSELCFWLFLHSPRLWLQFYDWICHVARCTFQVTRHYKPLRFHGSMSSLCSSPRRYVHTLGGEAENGEWLNSHCFPVKAVQQTSVLPVPVV